MASDFDKLFDDDWRPRDSDPEEGGLRGSRPAGEGSLFGAMPSPTDENSTSENENRAPRALNEKEVKVMGVYMHQEQGSLPNHFVLMRDNRGRRVPIFVGQFEALAISLARSDSR